MPESPMKRHTSIILGALKEARLAIGISAPVKTIGKIDYAISLLERGDDCDEIDLAMEVYGERPE